MKCCKDCRFPIGDRCANRLNQDLANAELILVEGGELMSTSMPAILPRLLAIRASTHPMSCGPSGQWYEPPTDAEIIAGLTPSGESL